MVYLHTNWKFKNHQENPHFLTLYTNFIKYRAQYRQTPQKSTLPSTSHTQSQPTIQTTFFLYKYKNPKKNPHFYRLLIFHQIYLPIHIKIHIKFFIPHIWKLLSYIIYNTYHTKHFLPVIIRLNQRKQYQISIKTTSMIKVSSKNKSV